MGLSELGSVIYLDITHSNYPQISDSRDDPSAANMTHL